MDTRSLVPEPPEPAPPTGRTRHVVVVSTDDTNASLVAETLDGECSVEVASTAADVDSVLSAPSLVSVAVVDATSATGDVREVVRRLHERDVPVLLLVASVRPPLRRMVGERAGLEVREKPVRRADLRRTVSHLART